MSGCLLDTHAFLWLAEGSRQLSEVARGRIEQERDGVYLSLASVWEMAIKISLGKLRIELPLDTLIEVAQQRAGIRRMDIRFEHLLPLTSLPMHHRDPFDRLLAAQCLVEDVELISTDEAFDAYGVRRIW